MSSRIEAGLTIEGSVRGEGELIVAGRLRGALSLRGTLVIEAGGVVEADVDADAIVISGFLGGMAVAHNDVRVQPGGRVEARVRASRLSCAEGALFHGEFLAAAPPVQVALPLGATTTVLRAPTPARVLPSGPPPPVATPSLRAFAPPPPRADTKPAVGMARGSTPPRMPPLPAGRTAFKHRTES